MPKIAITLLVIAVLLFLLVACLPSLERQLLYLPDQQTHYTPQQFALPYQTITLTTDDGVELRTWLLAPEDALTSRPWLLYFHGNATNITAKLEYPRQLYQLGYNVMLVEYRGFWGNAGEPHEAGLYQDARAHYAYLRHLGVPADKIVLHGFSLGTGVASELATQVDIAGLILEAPYTSIPATARYQYNKGLGDWLFHNHFRTIDKIAHIEAPLLIIHAKDDRVVPFFMGQELFAQASEPKEFIGISGGHNALEQGLPVALLERVKTFLARALL